MGKLFVVCWFYTRRMCRCLFEFPLFLQANFRACRSGSCKFHITLATCSGYKFETFDLIRFALKVSTFFSPFSHNKARKVTRRLKIQQSFTYTSGTCSSWTKEKKVERQRRCGKTTIETWESQLMRVTCKNVCPSMMLSCYSEARANSVPSHPTA